MNIEKEIKFFKNGNTTTGFKTDYEILKENFKFVWDKNEKPIDSWEENFAKSYYDKLYKEYCITDLTLYKQGKIGLRWCNENDLLSGKGVRICGNTSCNETHKLKAYEVNMKYNEEDMTKFALVKVYLCDNCGKKLRKMHKYLNKKRKRDKKKMKEIK